MKESVLPGLKPIREKLGLSQEKLGTLTRSSGEALSNIETGARGASLAFMKRLASALCCTADNLLSVPTEGQLRDIQIAFKRQELQQLERDKKAGAA